MTDHWTLTKIATFAVVLNILKMMMMTKYYSATGYIENNLPGNSSYHVKHDIQAASVLFYFRKVITLYIVINLTCFYLTIEFRFQGAFK